MDTNGKFGSTSKRQNRVWKVIGKTIVYVFHTALLVILVIALTPLVYFAWRAGQPMELPEFSGRTFYQVLADRQQTYAAHEKQWRQTHLGQYPLHSKNMCFITEAVFVFVVIKPGMDYALIRHIQYPNEPYYRLPANVQYHSLLDYLPASWTLFEMGALNLYQFIPHDPMAAYGPNHGTCIIPPPNGSSTAR